MAMIDLLKNVRIIEFDITESDESVRMFVYKRLRLWQTFGRGQQDCHAIHLIQLTEHSLENTGFSVEVNMDVNKFRGMILGRKKAGQQSNQCRDFERFQISAPSTLLSSALAAMKLSLAD